MGVLGFVGCREGSRMMKSKWVAFLTFSATRDLIPEFRLIRDGSRRNYQIRARLLTVP